MENHETCNNRWKTIDHDLNFKVNAWNRIIIHENGYKSDKYKRFVRNYICKASVHRNGSCVFLL